MAALRSLQPEEIDEVRRELAETMEHHAKLNHGYLALVREGEPEGSTYLQKLGWQIDACVRWIDRYRGMLRDAGVTA